jgi:hypothetical protein
MSENGNQYALHALKEKRRTLASEIESFRRQIRWREKQLVHLDATLRLFDPDYDPASLPSKYSHLKIFRQGELSRYVLDALRRAREPITTPALVTAILAAMGQGEEARRAIAPRVRGNLAYHQKRGMVVKVGDGREARWELSTNT